ncbi:MAG: fimbria major subunit, partial [Tannerella sp.]|nr:fimbria major subunit [Tannerella sp.]
TSTYEDEVLVRRNHVYDININKIKGPGIGNPNSIIIPSPTVPELDTFVSAEIKILDWHKVSQEQEVSYN